MEGTSGAKKRRCEGSGKKSKKRLKQKRVLETDKDNAEGIHGLPDAADEKIQDNEQHGTSKKKSRRKSKMESSDMTSVEQKELSERDETSVQGDGKIEDDDSRKPSGTTWVQTASWKSLVGETGRVTFMLRQNSDLRTGTKMSSTDRAPAQSSVDELSSNHVSSWIEGPSSAPRLEWSTMLSNGHSNSSYVEDTCKLTMKAKAQIDAGHLNPGSIIKTLDVASGSKGDLDGEKEEKAASLDFQLAGQIDDQGGAGGKVCRFMRSENYEQEWLEAKRAVKDIFKRTHKDALRSMKMFHKKQNP